MMLHEGNLRARRAGLMQSETASQDTPGIERMTSEFSRLHGGNDSTRAMHELQQIQRDHPTLQLQFSEYLAMGSPAHRDIAHIFRNPAGDPPVVYLTHGDGHSGLAHCLTGHDDPAKQKRGGNRGHLSDFIRLRNELSLQPHELEIVESVWHAAFGLKGRERNLRLRDTLEEKGIWPSVRQKIIAFIERAVTSGSFHRNDAYGHHSVRFDTFRVYVTKKGYITSAQWKYCPREISLKANSKALGLSEEAVQQLRCKLDSHHELDIQIVGHHRERPEDELLKLALADDNIHYMSWASKTNTYTLVDYKHARAMHVDGDHTQLPKDPDTAARIGPHRRAL